MPSGVLLCGPPGTGKTLLGKQESHPQLPDSTVRHVSSVYTLVNDVSDPSLATLS